MRSIIIIIIVVTSIAAVASPCMARADEDLAVTDEAEAEEGIELTVGAETAAASRYVFRGFALSDAPVLMPSAWASLAGVTLSTTTIIGTSAADGAPLRELDVDVTWSKTIGMLTLEPDLAAYVTPTGGSTAEAILTASIEGELLGVHTSHAVDLLAAPGAYYAEVGVSLGGSLGERVTLKAAVDAGFGTARFHSYNAGVSVAGMTVLRTSTELSVQVTEAVYLSGRIELDSLVARSVRRAADDPVLLHGGLAAGFEI